MKTKKLFTIITIFCLIMAGNWAMAQTAEELLPKAIQLEEVKGELEEAIEVYETIVKDFSDEREFAAKAQLHIGQCYEKLGKKQASEAYNKVIEQFADQQQTAEIAKTRLQNLNSQVKSVMEKPVNPTVRQIILDRKLLNIGGGPTTYDISHDGESLVFVSDREDSESGTALYVTSLSGPPSTRLISRSDLIYESRAKYSNDGNNIFFEGRKKDQSWKERELYQVKATGGKPKHFSKMSNTYLHGKYFFHLERGDNLVVIRNLSGDSISTFSFPPEFDHNRASIHDISPDAKWISYSAKLNGEKRHDYECWLVSFSGNKHIRLTNWKGNDGIGIWSEKNSSLYFVSERDGDLNIFHLNIDPETGERNGDAEQITFYKDADVFMLRFIKSKNALVYSLSKEISEIVVSENENFDSFKTIATGTTPVLSPDGNTVYFVGTGKDNRGIFSVPRTGGIKKKLTSLEPNTSCHIEHVYSLSPDGSTIAFCRKTNDDKQELYFLSTQNGKLFKSVTIDYSDCGIDPAWSPDSKKVAYSYDKNLYTIPAWSNKAEKLAELENGAKWGVMMRMEWSPDGRYIASGVYNLDDNDRVDDVEVNDIVLVSTQNGKIKRLTSKEEYNGKMNLSWHPGGKKLAYFYYDPNSDIDGIREAYVDGRPTTEIIDQPDIWDWIGLWDPSGKYYYFEGSKNSRGYIYKYNALTKEISMFSDIQGLQLPNFNKDGKYMVFSRGTSKNQLWMMEGVE